MIKYMFTKNNFKLIILPKNKKFNKTMEDKKRKLRLDKGLRLNNNELKLK